MARNSRGETGDRAARVLLSQVITPGDRLVGEAVALLGAEEALERLWCYQVPEQRRLAQILGVEAQDLHEFHLRYHQAPDQRGGERHSTGGSGSPGETLIPGDTDWPARFVDLGPFAPLVLYVQGNPGVMNSSATLGVVGTRRPSPDAVEACASVTRAAQDVGYTLVSGGARGIDWVAHVSAWNAGSPQVMVLATPLNRLSTWQVPALDRVADHGVVVTEAPYGRQISPGHFLHRNRLIAALSDRVVVVEAGERSGSLNTASHARKLGRDLSAMVWRGRDEKNAGCYRLLDEWGADRYEFAGSLPPSREKSRVCAGNISD